jgi:phosphoribosylanthranilate isomerase
MKIKVCGMKHPGNISELSTLPIHFMGMIFYAGSPRYADELEMDDVSALPSSIKRVGVFVDADIDCIMETAGKYKLDFVQLHGKETVEFCKELNKSIPVIKAFNVSEAADFEQAKPYENACNYFLFDTKTPKYGGSGQKFDWSLLDHYKGETPFFLSGGIDLSDAEKIKKTQHPKLYGIDINSRFETAQRLKNVEKIKEFIDLLNE